MQLAREGGDGDKSRPLESRTNELHWEGSSEVRGGEKHGRQGALTLPGSSLLAILGKRIAFDPHT